MDKFHTMSIWNRAVTLKHTKVDKMISTLGVSQKCNKYQQFSGMLIHEMYYSTTTIMNGHFQIGGSSLVQFDSVHTMQI